MTERRLTLLLLLFCIACKPAQEQSGPKKAAGGAQQRATVVTIRTVDEAARQTFTSTIVVSGNLARATGEHDVWRLYDTKGGSVTFVDDVARTYRRELMPALVAKRRAALSAALPPHIPRATIARTGQRRAIAGVQTEQSLIRAGAYQRELWLGQHPQIPANLFAMMQASEASTSPLAPMMRTAEEAIMAARGFPMLDRTEVPLGNRKFVVERSVVAVAQQDVPRAVLQVPRDYEDVTPKPAAAKKKP